MLGATSPSPLNLISGMLLLPVVFYFWIKLTSPQVVDADKWSIRFLLILGILSALGVFGFYLARSIENSPVETSLKNQLVEMQKKNEELSQKLEKYITPTQTPASKEKVKGVDIEGESIADLLIESSPDPTGAQKIISKTGIKQVDVYQSPNTTSKKIGNLELNLNYPYLESVDGWYKVAVTSSTVGWVSNTQVQEVY